MGKSRDALGDFTFERLRSQYIIAFVAIAASILIGELLVQSRLNKQLSDSRIINLAGRQRMLSQKLAKEVVLLTMDSVEVSRAGRISDLRNSLELLENTHEGLMHGEGNLVLQGENSEEVRRIYREIQPAFELIVKNTMEILQIIEERPNALTGDFTTQLSAILESEHLFLEGMDAVVFLYEGEAREKISFLKQIEVYLLLFYLLVLGFSIVFLFMPTTLEVKKIIGSLIKSEAKAKKNAEEVSALYKALQKSHEDLADISLALDQASVFAKADKDGKIFYISSKYSKLTGFKEEELKALSITDLIPSVVHRADFLEKAIEIVRRGEIWHDQVKLFTKMNEVLWLDVTLVPVMNTKTEIIQIIFMGSDITEKKIADEYYRKLDKKKFEQQIKEQRMKSALIVEGQEDERKRISKDIHDGIGQLLTGLKFQIEALNLRDQEKAERRLGELKDLVKEIILEVRRISFFLTPGVLEDYGLSPGVEKFVSDTAKYTGTELIFKNITGFNKRLDPYKEINLYRIIQEAVNNSIKYAKAKTIKVSFFHDAKKLTIIIQDDGMGFVTEDVLNLESKGAVGLGLYNMQERAMFVDGKIEIYSKPGEGTKIYLQTPI